LTYPAPFSNKVELKRFCSIVYAFPALDTEWTCLYAAMNWMKIQMGSWKPADAELQELQDKYHEAHVAHVVSEATGEEADLVRKDKTLAELRKKSKNSLELAATVLGDRMTQIYGRIIFRFTSIQHAAMVVDLRSCRDQAGSCRWAGIRTAEAGAEDCKKFAGLTSDMPFLRTLGLTTQANFCGQDPVIFEEETAVATKVMTMAIEMAAAHSWSTTQFWMTLPHSLAIGLHPDLHTARAGLLDRASDWSQILRFEAVVLTREDIPVMGLQTGQDGNSGQEASCLGPARHKYPQCAKLLDMLDFHKHQLVRELCFALSMPMEGQPAWSLEHPEFAVVKWMFGNISNTKVFLEDTFRDVRDMLKRTGQTTSRFLRQHHVIVSGLRRAKDHLLPIVNLPESAFVDTLLRRTKITDAVFTPPSNSQKGSVAIEQGRPFDVGLPMHLPNGHVLEPLIDLTQLMGSSVPQASKRSNKAGAVTGSGRVIDPSQRPEGQADISRDMTDQVMYRAAGPAAKHRSSAAMALVQGLRDVPTCDWEASVMNAWRGCLLGKGRVFKLHRVPPLAPTVFLSLGFVDYAVLCWQLKPFTSHDDTWCSLVCPLDMPLFWVYGHELTNFASCCGLATTLVVPALQPLTLSSSGLLWRVKEEVELVRFAFESKVPFTTRHFSLLAKAMNIRSSSKLMAKTNPKDQACCIAKAISLHVFPAMDESERLVMVQAMVEPDIVSDMVNDDPVLDHILEELRTQDPSYGKFEELHDQVKGQKAIMKAMAEHAAESRAGRVRGPSLQLTPFKYRAGAF